MRRLSLFSTLCLTATAAAQPAPPPGPFPDYLTRHAETRGFMLGRPLKPRPTPDGKAVLFLRSAPRVPELHLFEFDVEQQKVQELLTPQTLLKGAEEHLSPEEHARRERMRVSVRGFTTFDLSQDGTLILLSLSGKLYTVRRGAGASGIAQLPTGATPVIDPQLSPDGKHVAYVRDRDLYVLDLSGYKEHRLTHSQHPWISNGLAEFVAQEELSRYSGFWWSPDSTRLAFEEADTHAVETFHILDAAHPEAEVSATPYPRAGKENARLRIGVVSAAGGKPTWLGWDGERLPYVATVRWNEKGPLTVVVASRDQRHVEVLSADDRTGKTTPLVKEDDAAWVNLDQEMPRWLKDGTGFLWTSERSGGWELELRRPDGALAHTIVGKDLGYRGFCDLDEKSGHVVVTASREPSETQIYRVPLLGGEAVPLTREPGQHHAVFSKDHSIYVRTTTTLSTMPKSVVHRADGQEIAELSSVAENPPFRPRPEIAQVGDKAIRTVVLRPLSFVPGKKYPVVLDVYGGPHALQVTASMGRYLLSQWLADHGFVVVLADGRGTPARGQKWERAIHWTQGGSFAEVPLHDQVEALNELGKKHPEMDLQRVGVFGWSFGGYMAALSVLLRPDVFKVGVAGAPVVDWRDYDTAYTERYLGTPQENPKGYDESSLLTHAPKLSRPLLLIHGTSDDNVYFFHSLKLSQALFRAGKIHEFLPLSGLTHMVPEAVVTRRLWERIIGKLSEALHP